MYFTRSDRGFMTAESKFNDYKPAMTDLQASVEANRCLYCSDAPCIQACPTEINIPEFIRKIATKNIQGSAKTIFDANILGSSCARVCPVEVLCVGACVYNHLKSPPIQIGQLQRYATDTAVQKGWQYFKAGEETGKKIALIGAGPASLAAAHQLRRDGHACTIFESKSVLGGLNATGIAPYKMKSEVAQEEVDWILSIGGIDIKSGVEIGKDISIETLEKEYDAVFLGFGLGLDSRLQIQGENLGGVFGAVDWIEQMKGNHLDSQLDQITDAVVIGGGNTALDAVRELKGLGIQNVSLIYRRTEDHMSGYAHEWSAAKKEGVRGEFSLLPISFESESIAENGNVLSAVRCMQVDGQLKPTGLEKSIKAQIALLAVGQGKQEQLIEQLGLNHQKGVLKVDKDGQCSKQGFFAGGDCANGGKEVVNASAEGKKAAKAIHQWLSQGSSLKSLSSAK
jgi:dihydropyrimidine dehydrogenase (NAD+) subunit PreT